MTIQPFIDYLKVKENPQQIQEIITKLIEEAGKD